MKPFFISWLTHNRTGQRMWFLDADLSEDGEKWLGFKQFPTIHIYKMRPKEKYKGIQAAITHEMGALTQKEVVEDVYLSTVEPRKTNSILMEATRKQAED